MATGTNNVPEDALSVLGTLFDRVPIGLALFDSDFRYVRINEWLAKMNGLAPEAHVGRRVSEVLPPPTEGVERALRHVLEKGEPLLDQEFECKPARGPVETNNYLSSYYPIAFGENGAAGICEVVVSATRQHKSQPNLKNTLDAIPGMVLSAIDRGSVSIEIAERKRGEEALRRLAAIVESSDDAILGKTLDGVITSWNRAAERMYGYLYEEAVGQTLELITPPEKLDEVREILSKLRRGEHIDHFETVRIARGGRRINVSLSISPIQDSTGTIVGASTIARDITRQVRESQAQRFLAEAGATLASSLDYRKSLTTMAHLAVQEFADWCAIDILNNVGEIDRLAIAHLDPEKVKWVDEIHMRFPPSVEHPYGIANVLRTGEAEFYPRITREMLARGTDDPELLELLLQVGFQSVILVPLSARGDNFGAVTLVNSDSGRQFDEADFAVAKNLAERAALAVDNARLFEAERKSRRAAEANAFRMAQLQEITAALSEAATFSEVAEVILSKGIKAAGARAGSIATLTETGDELEIFAHFGYSEDLVQKWQKFSLEDRVPLADAVRQEKPVFFWQNGGAAEEYPEFRRAMKQNSTGAIAAIPLKLEKRILGAMGLSFAEPNEFSTEDREFLLVLARQCGEAIERARLYEAERMARAEAEAANRIKDEFLATLSHELRTPLTAVLGWAMMLRTKTLDETNFQKAVEVIERNARVQRQIVEDILDMSRIITGKLRLDIAPVSLETVVNSAVETVSPGIEAKNLNISVDVAPEIGELPLDRARMQQVMWNLLSNSVKFTPNNGSLDVKARRNNGQVLIEVKDSGEGIAPEFLPHVFDRFRQADGAMTRRHGGLGLGLAIVRQLIELHGGTVNVDSEGRGKGAVFTIMLPVAD